MSDQGVRAALEQMEAWVLDPSVDLDPAAIAAWNQRYLAELETAERGPQWQALVQRAHALGRRVDARAVSLSDEQQGLRTELDSQSQGARALKGYSMGRG